MLSTQRHDTCRIPTEHEPLAIERTAEFDQWIDQELARLEQNFVGYVTRHSALQMFKTGRGGEDLGRKMG